MLNERDASRTLTVRKDIRLVLDVFAGEPCADPYLVSVTDLITPHIAGCAAGWPNTLLPDK